MATNLTQVEKIERIFREKCNKQEQRLDLGESLVTQKTTPRSGGRY